MKQTKILVTDDSLFVFDAVPPGEYFGPAAYRKDWEATGKADLSSKP
jgi:hypothetical protein